MILDLSSVSGACITDVENDMYQDQLSEQLGADFIKCFKDKLNNAAVSDDPSAGRPLYAIVFSNKDGEEMGKAIVSDVHNVTVNENVFSSKDLELLLCSIEEEKCIGTEIWERTPSYNYFALMKDAVYADIRQNIKEHFIIPKCAQLDDKEIEKLKVCSAKVSFEEKNQKIDINYSLRVYSKDESSLYVLYSDREGNVFTEFGYEVKGLPFDEWISIVEK